MTSRHRPPMVRCRSVPQLWNGMSRKPTETVRNMRLPLTRKSARRSVPVVLAPGVAFASAAAVEAGTGHSPASHAVQTGSVTAAAVDLTDPHKKDIAMQLVSSAENSSLDWRAQYKYIEDIGDGRGYTAGIIGFCSGTGDMLDLVQLYTDRKSDNVLA